MNEKERLEFIMKSYNLTPSQFADRAGIQRASVSHILSGRNKASLEVLLKIYDSFPGLDMAWLMTGKGDAPSFAVSPPAADTLLPLASSDLFQQPQTELSKVGAPEPEFKKLQKEVVSRPLQAERAARRSSSRTASQVEATPALRKIKEIRIFYTDGTYETMVPEKQ